MAKIRTGVVTSIINNKTATVQVDRMVSHPKYGKRFRVSQKFAVHDESNQAHIGDTVTITETKPISKTKTWRLTNIVTQATPASEVIDSVNPEATK